MDKIRQKLQGYHKCNKLEVQLPCLPCIGQWNLHQNKTTIYRHLNWSEPVFFPSNCPLPVIDNFKKLRKINYLKVEPSKGKIAKSKNRND